MKGLLAELRINTDTRIISSPTKHKMRDLVDKKGAFIHNFI